MSKGFRNKKSDVEFVFNTKQITNSKSFMNRIDFLKNEMKLLYQQRKLI